MTDNIAYLSSTEHRSDQAYIIVKAAPRSSQKYGETVCIAGLDMNENWVRLYPVSFKYLGKIQRFSRWDSVNYRWRKPTAANDSRTESRHVDQDSIEIIGCLPKRDQNRLLNRIAVSSLAAEYSAGRSLALLKPEILEFTCHEKSAEDIEKDRQTRKNLTSQLDMFVAQQNVIPREPCPYEFKYRYRDEDGIHVGTCQDWETEATFFRRRAETNETSALHWMENMFGAEYPKRGMALAMGTHRWRSDQWLINGVIRLDDDPQLDMLGQ